MSKLQVRGLLQLIKHQIDEAFLLGSPSLGVTVRARKCNLFRWFRLFPLDRMVFGRVDNGEYFVGLRKFINSSND